MTLSPHGELQMFLTKNKEGLWGLPGGNIKWDTGESAEAAGVREVGEEIGVEITGCEHVLSSSTLNPGTRTHFYVALGYQGEPHVVHYEDDMQQEVLDVKAFTREEIQKMTKNGEVFSDMIFYAFDLAVVTLDNHISTCEHSFDTAFCQCVRENRAAYVDRTGPSYVDVGMLAVQEGAEIFVN